MRFALPLLLVSLLAATAARAQMGQMSTTASGGADITYSLPRDAKVSLNVLDANGWIIRELLRADPESEGSHTIHWDGNDAFGRPQPPGTYTWKLLHHTGLKADYVLSLGNSGQPPYRTDDDNGSWGACHGNPLAIQADSSGLYIVWAVEEGNPVFAHTDYDGRNIYKIHNSFVFGRNYDCVIVGSILYRLECSADGSYIEKFNRATGKFLPWDAKDDRIIPPNKMRIEKDARYVPDRKAPKDPNAPPDYYPDAKGLAANGSYIAASFDNLNYIALFQTNGAPLPDLQIDHPHGLLFLPDGRLLVAQPGKIVAVNLQDRSIQPFIAQNLDNPWGMTLDRDGRSLWVTDQGKSNQVKKFDLYGRLLGAIGTPGGMPLEGPIDHLGFYLPRGIACGTDGNIYVAEDSPLRRITRWSPDGKLLREWFGPEGSQLSCWVNPADFSEMYYQSSTKAHHTYGFIQCKVDLAKKTWYPVAWSQININVAQPIMFVSHGRKYMNNGGLIIIFNPKTNQWQPAVQFSYSQKDKSSSIWTDLNGSGKEDDGETVTVSGTDLLAKTGVANLNLSNATFDPDTLALHGAMGTDPVSLAPSRITPDGVPVYEWDKVKRLAQHPARGDDGWADTMAFHIPGVIPADDGGFFTAYNGGPQGRVTDFWDRASWNYLVKFGADGRMQWQVGVHAKKKPVDPRDMEIMWHMAGMSKHVIFLGNMQPAEFETYTDDGLFVDALMNIGPSLTPNSLTVENVVGLVAEDPATHKTYLFGGSCEDSRVWRITGFDSFQRLQGTITLKTAQIPPVPQDTYTIAATAPPREKEPGDFGADGFLIEPEWRQAAELPLVEDGVLKARIYLRHDDKYLWVGAHVIDSSPAKNGSQDPENAFTQGDCLDLYFGADPQDDAVRDAGAIGDVRVILYPSGATKMYNGTMVAYRMKVPDGTPKHPYQFASPAGSVNADSVTTIEGKDSVTRGGLCTFYRWPNGQGYTVEAKIPFTALPELGLGGGASGDHKIAFDAGVIFSNPAGTDRASRLYWHQQDGRTSMVLDVPTEAQIYPRLWGTAVISSQIAPVSR